MKQTTTFIPPEDIARMTDFSRRIRALRPNGKTPLALVETYGCQQNEADSEHIRGMLAEMGYGFTDEAALADVIVMNTCAVREHAEQRVFGNVGALTHTKRENPDQIICLCGCMVQQPHVVEKIRQSYRIVDLVFGPHLIWRFPEYLYRVMTERGRVFETQESRSEIAEGLPVLRTGAYQAWVSVMYGCNNFCSYCIVPYVRGRERSRKPEEILREVRSLVDNGCREITLLGQNVNSYGKDLGLGVDFAALLEEINAVPGEFLIRFMTSHPKDASPRLFDAMARSEKVARQLHLPFQAGNNRVLCAMNRGYTIEDYLALVEALRKALPDVVLTSDVIVGFPGETTEEFEDTLRVLADVRFDALFTFIYSPREGTPAAKLPDPLSKAEKAANFQRLVELQNRISAEKHSAYVGQTLRVLVDGESGDARWPLSARTNGGRLVHLSGAPESIGAFRDARITDSNTWALFGELI